jgi:hypothetical protein
LNFSKTFRPAILGVAILTAGLGAQAVAQTQPAAKPAAEGRMARHDPAQMAAKRAERLRAVLQLKPGQEAALNAYVAAMKPPEGRREAMRGQRQAMAQMTTPQRLDRMQAMMSQRQAEFERRAEATKRFYAQLDPAQQRAFDAMRPMDGHHGKRGPGRHMGHRG